METDGEIVKEADAEAGGCLLFSSTSGTFQIAGTVDVSQGAWAAYGR